MDEKVLVLMSTYNGSKYLRQQIDSVLSQEGCNVTLLIRDDGSVDETRKILDEYADKGNVSYYYKENLRSAKSFMHLLINCDKTYEYYAFCDQDDVWDNNKLIIAIRLMKENNRPTLYCGNARLVDAGLQSLNKTVYKTKIPISFERVLLAGEIQGATMVLNRPLAEVFDKIAMPEYVPMHDYYVATVCGAIGGKYIFDFESHMSYRLHESNVLGVSVSMKAKVKRNVTRVLFKNTFSDLERFSTQIMYDFEPIITQYNQDFLRLTSSYRNNIFKRIRLATNHKFKFGQLNQEISYRIALLLGNL